MPEIAVGVVLVLDATKLLVERLAEKCQACQILWSISTRLGPSIKSCMLTITRSENDIDNDNSHGGACACSHSMSIF